MLGGGLLYSACLAAPSTSSSTNIGAASLPMPPPDNAQHADQPPGLNCRDMSYNRSARDLADIKKTQIDSHPLHPYVGKTIGEISLRRFNVADETNEKEQGKLFRLVNKLHITTLPAVIKTQLLFESGERLSLALIEETERILRGRPYIVDAYIHGTRVCDDKIDIQVVTRDSWTTRPEVSFSRVGGESSSVFGFAEANILGTGNNLSITYENGRDSNSVSYGFSSPSFMNRDLELQLGFANTSDGIDRLIGIKRPFRSLNTPWSLGVFHRDITEVEKIRERDALVDEYKHREIRSDVFWGTALSTNRRFTSRLLAGVSKEESTFTPTSRSIAALPQDREVQYPWLGFQYIENRFGVYKNINQIQRPEDIPLGLRWKATLGYGTSLFDNNRDVLRYSLNASKLMGIGKHHLLTLKVRANGTRYVSDNAANDSRANTAENRVEGPLENSAIYGAELSYNHFRGDNLRWFGRLRYDQGHELLPHQQLTIGGEFGLRGYPTDYLRGDQRFLMTVERRYFSDLHLLNFMRVGALIFLDAGTIWFDDDSEKFPLRSNLGVGLRLNSSKTNIGNVVHIDFSVPTRREEGVDRFQWTLRAEQNF